MTHIRDHIRTWLLPLAPVLALLACQNDRPQPKLHDAPAEEAELSEEEARLAEMQAMHVFVQAEPDAPLEPLEMDPDEFWFAVWNTCVGTFDCGDYLSGSCGLAQCLAAQLICEADTLLAVAQSQAEPAVWEYMDAWFWHDKSIKVMTIPAQGSATNAATATMAARRYRDALIVLGELLAGEPVEPYGDGVCSSAELALGYVYDEGDTPRSVAKFASSSFVDVYQRGLDAFDTAVTGTIAAADSQRGSSPSLSLAAARATAGSSLSRAAAAHLLVGGSPGINGNTNAALCTSPLLTPQGKAALALLREAAVSPVYIMDPEVDMRTLLDDPDDQLTFHGVRQRLELYWNQLLPNSNLEDVFGLALSDFEEAREYLAQELHAFSRDISLTVPNDDLSAEYEKFAAVASLPGESPAGQWVGAVRASSEADAPWGRHYSSMGAQWSGSDVPLATEQGPNLSSFVDLAYSWAHVLTQGDPTSEHLIPLYSILERGERPGRVTVCSLLATSENGVILSRNDVHVDGYTPEDGLVLVFGPAMLSCALNGTIEGVPCETLHSVCSLSTPDIAIGADSSVSCFLGTGTNNILSTSQPYYVVRPRDPSSVSPEGPGDYVYVGAFWGHHTWDEDQACRDYPTVAGVDERVAEVFAPSRAWCTDSAVSCAGTRFDGRIPLENELSDDGDAVESSWRHYLNLAQESAAEADLLGTEYVASGLDVDREGQAIDLRRRAQEERAVAELQALQEICGTAVDPAALLAALSTDGEGGGDLSLLADPSTDVDAEIAHSPDLIAARECLGAMASEDVPYVHLGDATLCVWRDSNGVCGGEHNAGRRCPTIAAGEVCTDGDLPEGADIELSFSVPMDAGLNFFSTTETSPPVSPPGLAGSVRRLLDSPNAAGIAEVRSPLFGPPSLAELRRRLTVGLKYGGYVDLLVDGDVIASTGSTDGGPNATSWPCAENGRPEYCSTVTSSTLRCFVGACNSPDERRLVNERLMRAFAAAQTITWVAGQPRPVMPLPHNLLRGIRPRNSIDRAEWVWNNTGTDTVAITRVSNDRWTMWRFPEVYYGGEDPPQTGEYLEAFRLSSGATGEIDIFSLVDPDGNDHFAIQSVEGALYNRNSETLDGGFPIADYWKGLTDSLPGDGYFKQRLEGSEVPAEPAGAPLSAWFFSSREQTYNSREAHHVYQYLAEHGLEMSQNTDGWFWVSSSFEVPLNRQTLGDGLELIAELATEGEGGQWCNPENPPELVTMDDLSEVGSFLSCMGQQAQHRAATAVFAHFPRSALDPLRGQGANVYETAPGSRGAVLSDLRAALIRTKEAGLTFGREIEGFGLDVKDYEDAIKLYDINDEMGSVRFAAEVTSQVASCAGASASSASLGSLGGGLASGGIACANAAAQILFGLQLRSLDQQATGVQRELAANEFNRRFNDRVSAIEAAELEVRLGMEEVSRHLGTLRSLEQQAKRSLLTALWHMSDQAKNEAEISAVLAARKETARVRYERAHANAQRMAFLAKRAIEQRLAINLADMREDLPLVEAPATWESSVCETSGIRYETLREGSEDAPESYADAYIGDYVRKLENVVESYRLENDFHEGSDTAVVSLRDDIQNVRAECDVASRNLLADAGRMDLISANPSQGRWYASGCLTTEAPVQEVGEDGDIDPEDVEANAANVTYLAPNCLAVRPVVVPHEESTRNLPYYSLAFGPEGGCALDGTCGDIPTGWTADAQIAQTLDLEAGRYQVSWYGHELNAIRVNDEPLSPCAGSTPDLTRQVHVFDVTEAGPVTIGFGAPACDTGVVATSTIVGAPMLERLESTLPSYEDGVDPGIFAATDENGVVVARLCEDTTGEVFRHERWQRGCLKLCPDGYSSDCAERAEEQCYMETSFSLSQRAIETGAMFRQAGFARGNFNYRIESIGVNFVGTGIRNCADVSLPSTCYAAGYVPYTVIHEGPYFVRNHVGDDYRTNLFTGRIEHARGLATERYFSNPIGTTDGELLEQYLRGELRGRPLDGTFILRVWEEEGLDFSSIEDVQLIMKYRYWTRFE